MKFRKKPIVIEAFQLYQNPKPEWFTTSEYVEYIEHHGCSSAKIETLEGVMIAHYDDYIIKGVNGEIYPCKPDIFEKTYEPVLE